MQGISIFQQIYAPRVAHVVTGFDGVSHNTHSPYAIGGVVGSVGKMTAIVANDQADTWHIVNLKCGNLFDAVAVLGAFDESEAANMAMRYHGQYFDAVCGDVCESNTGGLQRFLNHHFYMSTNRPVYAEELAKLQDIPSTQAILWDGVQLKSHNGSSKHLLLDMMRCDDDKALLEKMDFVEEESKLDGEIAEYDALVVDAYKLESTVSKLALAMDKATSISTLKVKKQTLSKPKTMRGFGVIQQLVLFELSDGQAVSIIFNVSDSEANASAKMTKDDLLVAWKYKLNSRDITAAVQPNATQNVSLNMIASRIMGLADANSEKFVAAQKKKDAMQTELANTNQQVKDLQSQEQALLQEIADLQKQLDEKAKNKALQEAESRAEVEGIPKDVQSAPQERPTDYRTNLESARAVARLLGVDAKGKKLQTILKEIDIFDNNEMKKELLAEFQGLASRLVLPKGYVFDLSDAYESIGDITKSTSAWIRKQGKIDTNTIRIELRTNPDSSRGFIFNSVHIYTDDQKTKREFDKFDYQNFDFIGRSEAITPKEIIAKMEEFLTKFIFPRIEYLKVINGTELDPSKLSELGVANIESIGDENLYIEKDGKYYHSKVGNPQLYAEGEWDFAKYPDGKQVAPVEQPNNTLQKDISKSELFKDSNVWEIDDFGTENGMVIYSRDEEDGFSIGVIDKLQKVNMQYTDIDSLEQINESFRTENLTTEQVIEKIKMFIAKHEQNSVELSPVQPVSEPPVVEQDNAEKNMTAADFLALGGKEWVKDDMTRIYINAKVFNDLMGTSFGDSNNKFFFDVNTSALMRSYKGKKPQVEKQYEPVQQQSSEPVSEPPMTNPDRDYLQSIIDGKDTGLEPKAITAKIRQIVVDAKGKNDTEILVLADQAAKAYAAQVKAKAAAKLAEVQ